MNVVIDVVVDFVCPWCFVGEGRLREAMRLAREARPDLRFQVNWLPYFLAPELPVAGVPYRAFVENKFGGARQARQIEADVIAAGEDCGVTFDFSRIAIRPNTLRVHRLVHRAQSIGHRPELVEALVERLFTGFFVRGEDLGDTQTLAAIAAEFGEARDDIADYLESDAGERQVKSLADKVKRLGISGVPFYLMQRRLAVSGAQTAAALAAALLQAAESSA